MKCSRVLEDSEGPRSRKSNAPALRRLISGVLPNRWGLSFLPCEMGVLWRVICCSICKALISVPGTWSVACACLHYHTNEFDIKVAIKSQLHEIASWGVFCSLFSSFIYYR